MRKAIEVLEQSPKSLELLRDWIRVQITNKFKEQETNQLIDYEAVRENFFKQQLKIEQLADMLESNSGLVLEFFDDQKLFIHIDPEKVNNKIGFYYYILDENMENPIEKEYAELKTSRQEANLAAIDKAFEILENKFSSN